MEWFGVTGVELCEVWDWSSRWHVVLSGEIGVTGVAIVLSGGIE